MASIQQQRRLTTTLLGSSSIRRTRRLLHLLPTTTKQTICSNIKQHSTLSTRSLSVHSRRYNDNYNDEYLQISTPTRYNRYHRHRHPLTSIGRSFATEKQPMQDRPLFESGTVNSNNIQEMDFFGEPVTFFLQTEEGQEDEKGENSATTISVTAEESLMSFDTFILQYISRGKASNDGGDEFGIGVQASHSTAIPWSDLIKHVAAWCYEEGEGNGNEDVGRWKCKAPMLACAALSPMLALGGSSYLKLLDESYAMSMKPSFTTMAKAAISCLDDDNDDDNDDINDNNHLTIREKYHLRTLKFLLADEHSKALSSLRKLLEMCPGDALGLSLALDIASSTGDKQNAFQAATSVASYWSERGQRSATGQTAIPGYAIGSSLIALGMAVGGRYREAEQLVDIALQRDTGGSAGICAWALAHVYDSEGRVSEGTSLFTGYGTEYYENCGFMFFDSMMAGVGGRFVLDRDGASADRVSFRLYDQSFGRVLEYSGYTDVNEGPVLRPVPNTRRKRLVDSATGAATSVMSRLFGNNNEIETTSKVKEEGESENETVTVSTIDEPVAPPTLEGILTWLPPTPNLLTEATFLLARLTMSGAITTKDDRWSDLRAAWEKVINIEKKYCSSYELFRHSPLSRVASSFVLGDEHLKNEIHKESGEIEAAMALMGSLMKVNKQHNAGDRNKWKAVAIDLSDARSGRIQQKPFGWNQNFGYFLEHSICHAAVESEDYESLCIARSVCSESVVLRSNSPETWFRYGIVLEKLGDDENASNAFQASTSLGSGEGARISPT